VLLKYFSQAKPASQQEEIGFLDLDQYSRVYPYVKKACALDLFKCSEGRFYAHRFISQKDFLTWFFKLKYFDQPSYLKKKYPFVPNTHFRSWLQARNLNLLPGKRRTYQDVQEILYRDSVSASHFDQPYEIGLFLNNKDINVTNYNNLREIEMIRKKLTERIDKLVKKKKRTKEEKSYLEILKRNRLAFLDLKHSLITRPYILRGRPFSPEKMDLIRKYALQEVLYRHSYDYSSNADYRKHNLITAVKKFDEKVFQPGEVIDFWEIVSDKDLSDFVYGWVIVQDSEQWQFGGGLCGSSTMIYLPSWMSGLEILERRNHSKYFTYLYPPEEIGLDATIYQPSPNLKIRNNTSHPILFNVEDDEEKGILTLEIIGNRPYKNIKVEGPIKEGDKYVKWIRHIEDFDGKITSDTVESRYREIE